MRNEERSKVFGIKAENYFASLLNKNGIPHDFVDDWFDFIVNRKYKVEVKSCQLTVKEGKASQESFRSGRFDFTKQENREKQFDEDIWVAFVLRHENAFLLLGCLKAKKLNKKRYINLNDLRKLGVISFEKWLTKVNN